MRRGWLGVDQQRGVIVLEVFRRAVLGVGKLLNFELVGVGGKHCWSEDGVNISLQDLVSIYLMCPLRSGVLSNLVGEFLADTT